MASGLDLVGGIICVNPEQQKRGGPHLEMDAQ